MDPSLLLDQDLLRQMMIVATPLLLAALGEMIIERAGVLNVAIEGIMGLGAVCGFLGAYLTGQVAIGFLTALLIGALIGLILGYSAISLQLSQLTVGLALFVFAGGLASLLYRLFIGIRFVPPSVDTFDPVPLPLLSQIPYLGHWLFTLPLVSYAVLLLVPALSYFLFQTPIGLQVRATGENPRAADTLGVPVIPIRYLATIAGSALIGLGGALLPLMFTGTYTENMIAGRGWIALMLVIFGRWQPPLILLGALLFAYIDALQFRLGLVNKAIPGQFLLMLPYIFVILVLIPVYRGAQVPQALMRPYNRENRTDALF
jgi:ABC-type uncharacterized transport system permease subunit